MSLRQSGSVFLFARWVKINDPKVGAVGGRLCAGPPAPSPAAGHLYNPYCPVSWLPALGWSEHLLITFTRDKYKYFRVRNCFYYSVIVLEYTSGCLQVPEQQQHFVKNKKDLCDTF